MLFRATLTYVSRPDQSFALDTHKKEECISYVSCQVPIACSEASTLFIYLGPIYVLMLT